MRAGFELESGRQSVEAARHPCETRPCDEDSGVLRLVNTRGGRIEYSSGSVIAIHYVRETLVRSGPINALSSSNAFNDAVVETLTSNQRT